MRKSEALNIFLVWLLKIDNCLKRELGNIFFRIQMSGPNFRFCNSPRNALIDINYLYRAASEWYQLGSSFGWAAASNLLSHDNRWTLSKNKLTLGLTLSPGLIHSLQIDAARVIMSDIKPSRSRGFCPIILLEITEEFEYSQFTYSISSSFSIMSELSAPFPWPMIIITLTLIGILTNTIWCSFKRCYREFLSTPLLYLSSTAWVHLWISLLRAAVA